MANTKIEMAIHVERGCVECVYVKGDVDGDYADAAETRLREIEMDERWEAC